MIQERTLARAVLVLRPSKARAAGQAGSRPSHWLRINASRVPREHSQFNVSDANAAAQALLDQVFINVPAGAFNTDPSLTLGCGHAGGGDPCIVDTPYSTLISLPGGVNVAAALNTIVDTLLDSFLPYTFSTNNGLEDEVWALWTPAPVTSAVPEPETYA